MNPDTRPAITKLFQRHPFENSAPARLGEGFSQKRRIRNTCTLPTGPCGQAGSIQPYSVSGELASIPRRTIAKSRKDILPEICIPEVAYALAVAVHDTGDVLDHAACLPNASALSGRR
jgi:hypothetical protein